MHQILDAIEEVLPEKNLDLENLHECVKNLVKRISLYWKLCKRMTSRFLEKYSPWLSQREICKLPKNNVNSFKQDHLKKMGRPKKQFLECSTRSKRRRIAKLSDVDDSAIKYLTNTSDESTFSQADAEKVLSLVVEAKLTKHQYLLIKNFINSQISFDILPSYNKILAAKKKCYPLEETITESSAEVELQSLLDHTTNRILESQKDVLESTENLNNLTLIGKWGFDGSTGHSEYKQTFADSSILDDSSLFVTSYVPLQLICNLESIESTQIIWKNPRPCSTRYCRPIRFQFAKETSDLSIQEQSYFKNKIQKLNPTTFSIQNKEIKINHSLQLTMVDGKICSALSKSATSRCYLCGSSPKEMNQIDACLNKTTDNSKFEFGLSPLHSWIRFFEYFIHLSYRITIKKWQVRSLEEKNILAANKKRIQQEFRNRLGLIIDKPRSGGSGTSNDGNTARKFFTNSSIAAEITGIEQIFIDRCGVILNCISSGFNIDKAKFKEYTLNTARHLVQKYPWFYLPASVHKVLIHGCEIIENALVSIGELSEEAAESTNKHIKLFRRDHTRKMSRITTNTDLLHRLLLHSDPFITGLRKLPSKKKSLFSKEVLNLLDLE